LQEPLCIHKKARLPKSPAKERVLDEEDPLDSERLLQRRGFLDEEDPLDAERLLQRRGFLDEDDLLGCKEAPSCEGEGSWKKRILWMQRYSCEGEGSWMTGTWMERAPGRLCCRGTFREYRDSDFRGSAFIYGEVHAVLDEQQKF
jgi:hypothetical protein